jgi:hypothetical protein
VIKYIPATKGISIGTFFKMKGFAFHHFFLLAITLIMLHKILVKIATDVKRLNTCFPKKGAVNQGRIKVQADKILDFF